ncbi:vacuolar protein sorting-associated protein 51 homolog [Andrographis paniculata]|uniref:vacuolar protein sorting-associated protein 51 homolog n=1 Tax=Andrographis paniculata TaxID=175694 RepID=UPI0021E9A33A|nr:vacuolar protein sorting-associated protein 51 homolog [Andrographis paniculata]XP_051118752.1 vacuolar protein sorting-associated protein 51 homolog [Andrographis paniculata]
MEVEGGEPLDDKAKRMRDLLSSFYSQDPSSATTPATKSSWRYATLDTINTASFDADLYMNLLVQKSNLEGLLQKHVEMAAEIKNLDTDLQMLVYENYNKFISATDTIKRMKNNIAGMETNMEQLLEKIMSVQSRSDGVDTSLFEKREQIEKVHRTRNLLRKVQFIYDLPARLEKCIKLEAYSDAVKFYVGAMPIFKAYGDSSFHDCKRQSEEAVNIITKNLQGKVFSDSESIQTRAEAVMLLKQLDFPVENLKVKLFEKLEQYLMDLRLQPTETSKDSVDVEACSDQKEVPASVSSGAHEASVREFAEAVRAYKEIFSHSEPQLSKLAHDLIRKHFEATHQQIKKQIHSADLVEILRVIWTDVLLMDEVLPEALLPDLALQSARDALKDYFSSLFNRLLLGISDAITKAQVSQREGIHEEHYIQEALEASRDAVIQGSRNVLQEFRHLHDENSALLVKLRDLIVDWVQEGFQNFFRKLDGYFRLLSGKSHPDSQELNFVEKIPADKISPGLVLVLAELSLFIEQNAISKITEEIASSFSDGGIRGSEYGPAFVPAEICRIFRSSVETFLHLYIKMRTQKISIMFKKRFAAPNWVKHKEPREVHMFVDLLLQQFEEIGNEVKQVLPQSIHRKHHRTDSNGSTTSSRSNPLRDDRLSRSTTQKARSQLLETHLAKLFKQKMEIFTKIEHTQESVITTIVKLSLKSLQEFVRLQTFNRSGFQQIQLDIHFLKSTLKDISEDEAAVDFLLDEVTVGTAERCLDPIPLEPPILDRLVQAKLAKNSEQK